MAILAPTATPSAYIGASIRRREHPRLITGHAVYVDDVVATGSDDRVGVLVPGEQAHLVDVGEVRDPGRVA